MGQFTLFSDWSAPQGSVRRISQSNIPGREKTLPYYACVYRDGLQATRTWNLRVFSRRVFF